MTINATQLANENKIYLEMQNQYMQSVELYKNLQQQQVVVDLSNDPIANRLPEFEKQQDLLQKRISSITQKPTESGKAMIWQKSSRINNIPFQHHSSIDFNSGPESAVVTFSGEFTDSATDIALPQRGELGFAFERYYSSLSESDYGLGIGWDYNFNASVRENVANQELIMHWHGVDICFNNNNGVWEPQAGEFLSLEIKDTQIFILTPDLTRMEFSLSQDTHIDDLKHWRLSAIASRHNEWKANRIEVNYLSGCDRIAHITDPYGQEIRFSYNRTGHITQITTTYNFVEFDYNELDYLVSATYPSQFISLSEVADSKTIYEYQELEDNYIMTSKAAVGIPYTLNIEYDNFLRVSSCGYYSTDGNQVWDYKYNDKTVEVVSPSPSPTCYYEFNTKLHPSLPSVVSIPAQDVICSYEYASNYLVSKKVDSLGVESIYGYDLGNINPRFRGNILSTTLIPNDSKHINFKRVETETLYHAQIASPISNITYQVNIDGTRSVVNKELFDYSGRDFMLSMQNVNSIISKYNYNKYGELAMSIDGNDNVTIYKYSEKLPEKSDYNFVKGETIGGGPLVSVIQDATSSQIKQACNELKIKPYLRKELNRIPSSAIETKTAWDVFGNQIRTQRGYAQSVYIVSPSGRALATYNSNSGMTINRYSSFGEVVDIKHEFCPKESDYFVGDYSFYFKGNYYTELFNYNNLCQLVSYTPSNEPSLVDGEVHNFTFERYPNGKLKSIVNLDGVKRIDVYSNKTGWLESQELVGKEHSNKLILSSEYQYYADGSVKSYKDQFGGIWSYELDGFGEEYSTTYPNGVIYKTHRDAIGRTIYDIKEYDGELLTKQEYLYNQKSGLLDSTISWRIAPNISEYYVTEQYKYDAIGNIIAKRNVQNDSWSYFLIDGLNRQIASCNPAGDLQAMIFNQDILLYIADMLFVKNNEFRKSGVFKTIDYVGRTIQTIPVDTLGKLINDRKTTKSYNAIGQLCEDRTEGLSSQLFAYNTLGNTINEATIPESMALGESPLNISYSYSPGGQLLLQTTSNHALLLYEDGNNITPELVDAPQITEYKYDEFGREFEIIQPDGLIISKKYNEFSLPQQMYWTHVAEPTKMLRSLELDYSNMGQVLNIKDKATENLLRVYSYDLLGNCTKMQDLSSATPVILERSFDSLGLQTKEKTNWGHKAFPVKLFDYDLVNGESMYVWDGLTASSSENWNSVTVKSDPSGRIEQLKLQDDDIYANWSYVGNLAVKREIPESNIVVYNYYNSMNEPETTSFNFASSPQELGRLEYAYGNQGQAEFSSTKLVESNGKEYNFSMFAQFDAFRRLVAQNGELRQVNASEYKKRFLALFDELPNSNAIINTSRMQYDQNNNIWVNYSGVIPADFTPEAIEEYRAPQFISATLPVDYKSNLSDLILRELASNREVCKASLAEDGTKLDVEEFIYDRLGNLTSFKGDFWNGIIQYPVRWTLSYDALGRLISMKGHEYENIGDTERNNLIAELNFVYDAENRRIGKIVKDFSNIAAGNIDSKYTLYDGNNQALVFSDSDSGMVLLEQYLWKPSTRELLAANLPMRQAENVSTNMQCRYFFQQDRGLNVVFASRSDSGRVVPVSAISYLGFGENATFESIKNVSSSMGGANIIETYNHDLDDLVSGSWANIPGEPQYIEIELEKEVDITQLTIWATENFPNNFLVYVLPKSQSSPYSGNINSWVLDKKDFLATVIQDSQTQNKIVLS